MPIVTSLFSPPRALRPAWLQTVLPPLIRNSSSPYKTRETLPLTDGDTLELAWFPPTLTPKALNTVPALRGVVILSHGLEGSIDSHYILGLARALTASGFLALAWNMRGCGATPNALPSWYHSGKSDDLAAVVDHVRAQHPTLKLFIIGVSIGGNILCKYLGELGASCRGGVEGAVAVSVPLDLRGSAEVLARPSRRLYMEYLLRPLRVRIREKARRFPNLFDTEGLDDIATFHEFDARYTAPLHGFTSVDHYWDTCSGLHYLEGIQVPLLILTAQDDPFLSASCFPTCLAAQSSVVSLESPPHGGHVGFVDTMRLHTTWLERRAVSFIEGLS